MGALSGVVRSGMQMTAWGIEHLGWNEVSERIIRGIEGAIAAKTVTYDFARQMQGATQVSSSKFAEAVVQHM